MEMKNLQEFHSPLSFSSSSPSLLSNLHPLDIGAEEWEVAERRVCEILPVIQPTVVSERRRKDIIEYIQILIGATYGIKVFPFGSVPLKTYLPDGDIDLTVLCQQDEEVLSGFFCCLLQNEETMNSRVQVRNVQCVPAEVKVVKCYVEDIAVDITFNQMTGLCALSFLEQVDQLIGKGHLFKRSVILIKAWCFYESRILGAHHGLIATYALETMVAHIINLFHSSLHSPLAVLYKFLGYYSKFDWGNYCVAINGLVLVSSLPKVVVQPPNEADDMLLGAEFLLKCRESYSLSTGLNHTGEYPFHRKFLNVVDPLRDNNNLGRSVNKANFNRIKLALSFATEKINCILASPVEEINVGIESFFKTMLGSNGKGKRPDGVPLPELVDGRSGVYEKLVDDENLLAGIQYGLWSHDFGIYQGCDNPMYFEMWTKMNLLGFAGRHDLQQLFLVNENLAQSHDAHNFSRLNHVSTIGEITKSRGTGTYIPLVQVSRTTYAEENGKRLSTPISSKEFVPIESILPPEDGSSSWPIISLLEFSPLPATNPVEIKTNPTSPYLAAQEANDNLSMKSMEFEITQVPPCSVFLPMDESPPVVDPPISIRKAEEEKDELLENEVKKVWVEKPSPTVMGLVNEYPDFSGLRLEDTSEFPPLLGNPQKGASGRK